jgi:hypothetical protein
MATIDTTVSEAQKGVEAGKSLWVRKRISFATNPTTTSDTMKILKVAPYTIINTFQVTSVTAEGATATCDFGVIDSSASLTDDNYLDDSVDLNQGSNVLTRGAFGTDTGIGYRFGATGGFITADPDHDLDTAVIDVLVELVRGEDHA